MASLIGQSMPRVEDDNLLRGRGRFLDDIQLPGVLHVAFLRSEHAHALVTRLDVALARGLPGVHAVITMSDLMKVTGLERMPLGASPTKATGPITPYILSGKEVAFVGEAMCMVVAHSRAVAEDAVGLIEVDYKPLPVVADIRKAVVDASVTVRREATTNVLNTLKVAYGDIDAAFATASHVFKEDLWQHRGCAHPMETRGVVAECRPDGGLNVWSSTQMPNDLLTTIVELDPIYCEIEADERSVLKYREMHKNGERVSAMFARIPAEMALINEEGWPHKGEVDFVDNQLNPATGTIRARAVFPNADRLMAPGFFAKVRIPGSGEYDGLLIRDSAVGDDQGSSFVWVLDAEDKAVYRAVTLGPLLDGLRVVRSGLKADERVVVLGLMSVRNGAKVKATQTDMLPAAATK